MIIGSKIWQMGKTELIYMLSYSYLYYLEISFFSGTLSLIYFIDGAIKTHRRQIRHPRLRTQKDFCILLYFLHFPGFKY